MEARAPPVCAPSISRLAVLEVPAEALAVDSPAVCAVTAAGAAVAAAAGAAAGGSGLCSEGVASGP